MIVAILFLLVSFAVACFIAPWSASVSCSRVVGQDSRERDNWTFSGWHGNTLLGRTVGKFCVAIASAHFQRQQKKRNLT